MYRRKLGKSKVNNIHRFVSHKNASTILTESTLEFHGCYPLEYDYDVISFESQPEGYEYIYENKVHRYTPDYLSRMKNGQEPYIEVKPSRIAKRKDFLDRFYCMQEAARKSGRDLLLWTEDHIRKQPYLDNLQILHKYRTPDAITAQHRKVLATASSYSNEEISIHELACSSGIEISQSLSVIFDLIARNLLASELSDTALTKKTLVGINHDYCSKIY
ncbi:TnsA endonuclease N-terminal domain-containing protein [Endozoicomonas sp. YOMI1]|uniref:TnsA endonuclease N-terminal domain-containing protein n=1 Tax=Endozoicomonas sp. YOMI1 TaxID=2828739 RepID=UPI002147E336|nr:TnsA endonuclease N-terminal domain-containing protein [Endozoicomonas sp. YOMI1]